MEVDISLIFPDRLLSSFYLWDYLYVFFFFFSYCTHEKLGISFALSLFFSFSLSVCLLSLFFYVFSASRLVCPSSDFFTMDCFYQQREIHLLREREVEKKRFLKFLSFSSRDPLHRRSWHTQCTYTSAFPSSLFLDFLSAYLSLSLSSCFLNSPYID